MQLNKIILSCLLTLVVTQVFGQFSKEYYDYKNKYPNAYNVRQKEVVNIDVKLEDDEIVIYESVDYETILLSKGANMASKGQVHYSSFSSIDDLKASAFNFENGKYIEQKVNDFVDSDDLGQSFYDDSRKIEYLYKGLSEGSKTNLSYTRKISNPRFLSRHFFGSTTPIEQNELVITVDNKIDMEFKSYNLDSINVNHQVKKSKSKTTYSWKANDIKGFDFEYNAPNYVKLFPQVIPIIKSYQVKNETVEIGGSVDQLFDWYYSLIENINKEEPCQEMKDLVAEITEGKESNIEKVRAIYYWTQENIKYIAFEYALGGFVPREANAIFNKKYGDCKDNSSILFEMLKVAGLEGYMTWVGTRDIPFTYEELPTPAVDNHMILTYKDGDQSYYLDATGRYTPLEMTTSFIQGKEVMVGVNKDKYLIETVPVYDSHYNQVMDSVVVHVSGNDLIGSGKVKLKGYPKSDLFNVLEQIDNKSQLEDYYTRQLRKGSNRFIIDEFNEINKFSYDEDFYVDYKFNIKNYIKSYENEVYVNLNLFGDFTNFKVSKDRKSGKKYEYQNYNVQKAILEIPNTHKVTFVPKNYVYDSELFYASINYTQASENKIIYTLTVEQKFIDLDYDSQMELDKEVRKIEKHYKDVIVLTAK